MPRYARHAALTHFHDYIPPHSDPNDKIYVHHRRHCHHTYKTAQPDTLAEKPEPHETDNPDINDKN